MSYAKEKARIEKIRKRVTFIIATVLFLVLLGLCILSAFYPLATWKYHFYLPDVQKRNDKELRLHFIDVGQGDCVLIELPDNKVMLVDGGNGSAQSDKAIMRYLNALDIDEIDYMLVTHPDADHCGGLDTVLKYTQVNAVYLPPVSSTANAAYAKFYKQLNQEGCGVQYTSSAVSLSVKESKTPYTLQMLYPYMVDAENLPTVNDSNALSGIFWLDYQGVSALFTGDAPKEIEELLMRDDNLGLFDKDGIALKSTEILKVAHHGSANSTSEQFLRHLGVETAVISCGVDNEYDHPSTQVKNALGAVGAATYRTDTQGSVVVTVKADGTYAVQTLGK